MLTLQRQAGNAAVTRLIAARQHDTVRNALRIPGRPLDGPVRADMQARLGADLSGVRVHTGPAADRAARAVASEAFTTGSHLVFRQGRYNPASAGGRRVLAHELAHVLQQRNGPVAGTGRRLKISDPADRFERAAETTARTVMEQPGAPVRQGGVLPPAAHQPGEISGGLPVQRSFQNRHYVDLSPVNTFNGSGTLMHAELHPGRSDYGSRHSPTKKPPWWKKLSGGTAKWFSRNMVQGHLLNDLLSGPGNTMENLTPITQRANRLHETRVESKIKNLVIGSTANNIVEYEVRADYNSHPTGSDLTHNNQSFYSPQVEQDIDNTYGQYMAESIEAEYTIYDMAGNDIGDDSWQIYNEAS